MEVVEGVEFRTGWVVLPNCNARKLLQTILTDQEVDRLVDKILPTTKGLLIIHPRVEDADNRKLLDYVYKFDKELASTFTCVGVFMSRKNFDVIPLSEGYRKFSLKCDDVLIHVIEPDDPYIDVAIVKDGMVYLKKYRHIRIRDSGKRTQQTIPKRARDPRMLHR